MAAAGTTPAGVTGSGTDTPPKTRAQALRSFDVADFPVLTGREEEWRFTPLKRLRGLVTADATTPVVAGPKPEFGALPEGVTVTTVARGDGGDRAGVLVPFDRISAFAWGRAEQTLRITVAPEAVLTEPATVRLVGTGVDGTAVGHTVLEVGRLAQGTVVLEQVGSVTLADNVEVVVGEGAQLTLVTVTDWALDAVQAQHLRLRVGRDARVRHVQVTLGGDLVRQYTSVEYAGPGGDVELYGVYFATGLPGATDPAGRPTGQHLEHRLLVDHAVPDCRSYVNYRGGVQGDGTRTVWVGDVLIQAAATGTDTFEINRNLLLTDGARADSVPNLEIETGEVVGAGHASATARFDEEQLFYLMSRGIDAAEARRLVVRGFFGELLDRIPVEELRDRLVAAVDRRLDEGGAL